jgi:ketosteroid isomerase-like protein
MGTEENRQIVKDLFAALSKGDVDGFLAKFADDVHWKIQGSTKFSGTYAGKGEVVAKLLAPLGAELEGHLAITAERITAEGDRVVVEGFGQSATKSGNRYDNHYCWVYRMAGGKIVEVNEYLDTELVTHAFGR